VTSGEWQNGSGKSQIMTLMTLYHDDAKNLKERFPIRICSVVVKNSDVIFALYLYYIKSGWFSTVCINPAWLPAMKS